MSNSGCVLDRQQIEAVVACEDAQLVLASAGSGKTMSLLAKIDYLNRELDIPAERILVISFTQKTVSELKERCDIKGINIHTFHSLGNSILKNADYSGLGLKKLLSDTSIATFIRSYVEFLIKHDASFARAVVDYILFFYSAPSSPARAQTHSGRINFNRIYLRHALFEQSGNFIRTKDEQLLANWLYVNNLPHVHERQYPFCDEKYQPSFTIKAPRNIYLDYFIINQKGHSIYGPSYMRDIKWRQNLHMRNHTNYIILPSWRWNDLSIFQYLTEELKRFQINVHRRDDREVYQEMSQNQYYAKELDGFYGMLQNFLSLHKNGLYDFADIKQRLKSDEKYSQRRNDLFLSIYQRVYYAYEKMLQHERRYDFADMINAAKESIDNIADCSVGYKYILLDEVQDLSRNRCMLVHSILHKNPGCKLFAVGDDWQSIYRFTGSDLSLINNFENTFELRTRRSFIESTHRFGEPTIKISCDFIQRNPAQSHKLVRNIQNTKTTISIILNKPNGKASGQDAESLVIILQELITKYGYGKIKQKSLQLISRYNHDIKRIESDVFKIKKRDGGSDIYDVI